jgi:hypothetical protein
MRDGDRFLLFFSGISAGAPDAIGTIRRTLCQPQVL